MPRLALRLGFAVALALAPVIALAQAAPDPYSALDATLAGAPTTAPALADPNAIPPDLGTAAGLGLSVAPGIDIATLIRNLETLFNLAGPLPGGGGPPPPAPFPGGNGGGGGGPPLPAPLPAFPPTTDPQLSDSPLGTMRSDG